MKAGEIKEKERQHIPSAWKREQDKRKEKSISSTELALSPFIAPPAHCTECQTVKMSVKKVKK